MKIPFTLLFILQIIFQANAQTVDSVPGRKELPSSAKQLDSLAKFDQPNKYTVEDFLGTPAQSEFILSPDGRLVAYKQKDSAGKIHLMYKNLKSAAVFEIIKEADELFGTCGWINNRRIYYLQDHGGNENYQLYAVNIDGSNKKALTAYKKVTVSVLKRLPEQPDFLIIQMNKNNPEVFSPYRINVNTGQLTGLYDNKDTSSPIMSYQFDKDGQLKAFTRQVNGTDNAIYVKLSGMNAFKKVLTTSWKDDFTILDFAYQKKQDEAYVLTNLYSNTDEILLYNLRTNKVVKKVFSQPEFDVNGLVLSKQNYQPAYFTFTGEKASIVPESVVFKKIYAAIQTKFNGELITIMSTSDREDKFLLFVASDRDYGSYYLYDSLTNQFTLIQELMPKLEAQDMAEMRPIKFRSRDGLMLYGYLTIPKQAGSGQTVPLIVNPHGGPYGIRDQWQFSLETQLFASRGFATLQINYRGSGGYGKKFYLAGSKQIGRNMLNDLEDGVTYVKKQTWIKINKTAIYGGSYGGLATLGSLVKTPDLYTCAVDYCGVSNLFTFFKAFPPYWKPFLKQVYEQWYDPETEKEIIKTISPALNADKITKPVLVIQGANDPRVNINESNQLVENLRSRGIAVPYMVKNNEGHGYSHEDNIIQLYKTIIGFLENYLN